MNDPMNWFNLYRSYPAYLDRPSYNQTNRIKPWGPPPLIKNKFAKNILITLALGAGGALVTMNPAGAVYLMVHGAIVLALKDKDYYREVKRLKKRGYVALTKKPKGMTIKLLDKARIRLKKILIEDITLPKFEKWDAKWRVYMFDIPEKNRISRNLLRRKLKELGMFNIQRSVFVYPYDCRKELEFLSGHYGITEHCAYMEISQTDIDKELRQFFKL